MNPFNKLSNELLVKIFKDIQIVDWHNTSSPSYLGCLLKCGPCEYIGAPCHHVHENEAIRIKELRLVCKRWRDLLKYHFTDKFEMYTGMY